MAAEKIDLDTLEISPDLKQRINNIGLYGKFSAPLVPLDATLFYLKFIQSFKVNFNYWNLSIPLLITGLSCGFSYRYLPSDYLGLGLIPANIYLAYSAWKYFQCDKRRRIVMNSLMDEGKRFQGLREPFNLMIEKLQQQDFNDLELVVGEIESIINSRPRDTFARQQESLSQIQKDQSWYMSGMCGHIPVIIGLLGWAGYLLVTQFK
jgi:hypothetical protein